MTKKNAPLCFPIVSSVLFINIFFSRFHNKMPPTAANLDKVMALQLTFTFGLFFRLGKEIYFPSCQYFSHHHILIQPSQNTSDEIANQKVIAIVVTVPDANDCRPHKLKPSHRCHGESPPFFTLFVPKPGISLIVWYTSSSTALW